MTAPGHRSGGAGFGARVRARRAELGLTLAELGARVGCGRSYLSRLETGVRPPPTGALFERLEDALGLERGSLRREASWARAPGEVKRDLASLQQDRRAVRALRDLVERDGLDGAYRSGELGRLIDGLRPPEEGVLATALPAEVPVINMVSAGQVREFTDLGYPARVADEYVRCPDLHDPDAFAARVVGDSMEPDYRQGDIVVFSPARAVEDGSDCFVRLEPDHETTFKRVYFEADGEGRAMIRIQPINNRYAPRTVARERVAGLYRAASVIRAV